MKKIAIVVGLLGAGLLFTQFAWLAPVAHSRDDGHFAQKVNLALRRTAHHLLLATGDSTSRIAPVRQLNPTTFSIRLEHPFDYGRLPALLQQSMAVHRITDTYDVAVLDCTSGQLQLGYTFRDMTDKNGVPCAGREQKLGCYNIQLTFAASETTKQPTTIWWTWAVGFLLVSGAYVAWQKSGRKLNPALPAEADTAEPDQSLYVGNLSFSLANQSVRIGGNTHPLTYREAKLLHLFLRHPNQLLERDFILKSVWEDEGIIVGRSVDVFVSRLRKLLQPDPSVRIVAVHGVGYRLEAAV